MFSCQLISCQEHVRHQTKPSTSEGTYQGVVNEGFQGVPSLTLPMTEHDHVTHREETSPSEANERMEENNNKCASLCNVENAHEVTKVVGERFQGVSSLALSMTELDRAISCNVENEHVKITIPSQDEQDNDEDDPSAKDLLCLAWQIAQGMVSRNWNSPE